MRIPFLLLRAAFAALLLTLCEASADPVIPTAASFTVTGHTLASSAAGTLHNDGSGNLTWGVGGQFLSGSASQSASFTVSATGTSGKIYYITTGSSVITVTLPSAGTSGAGWFILLQKADSSSGHYSTSPSTISVGQRNATTLVWSDGSAYHAAVLQPADITNGGTFSTPILQTPTIQGGNISGDPIFSGANKLTFPATSTLEFWDDSAVKIADLAGASTAAAGLHLGSAASVYLDGLSGGTIYFDSTLSSFLQGDGSGNLTFHYASTLNLGSPNCNLIVLGGGGIVQGDGSGNVELNSPGSGSFVVFKPNTGHTPVTPGTTVSYLETSINGTTYYIPLVQ